jgi:hypothetical protein
MVVIGRICAALTLVLFLSLGAHADQIDSSASFCLDKTQGEDRARCVTLIGAIREMMRDGKAVGNFRACSPSDPNNLSDTYAIIDWIETHPQRQEDSLLDVAPEVLQQLHPCT